MKTKDLKKKSAKPAEGTKKTAAKKASTKKISKTSEGKTNKTARKSPIEVVLKTKKIEKKRLSTKTVAGKVKVEAKVKVKPKARISKISVVKPKPAVKPEKKAATGKPTIKAKTKVKIEAKAKAKPKAVVAKVSIIKPKPAAKPEKKAPKNKTVAEKVKAKVTKISAVKTPKKKAVIAKAKVEVKAKAKPKAIVSKVSAIKPKPLEKIGKKTAKSGTEINMPNKSVKPAAMPQIATKSGMKETPAKAGTKRTPAALRQKVSGTAVMGRISIAPKKEISVPASPSFTASSAGEKTVKKDMVTQEAEQIPLKSHKARLKIFLPNQDLTKEEAEEIFLGGLPEEYGENSVIALAVDPNIVFVDWEVIPGDIADMEGDLNLRFYDVTGIEFNDWNANAVIDVLINKRVGSGFFDIRMPGSDVVVAVGILNAVSGFMTIARSDTVSFPALMTFDELGIVQKLFESGSPVGY